MRLRHLRILCLFLLVTLGCNFPTIVAINNGQNGHPLVVVTSDPNGPPTATPFLPLSPTQYVQPTDFLTPTPGSPEANPNVKLLPNPAGTINILILGSDQRPYDFGYRTDVMILLSVNTKKSTASMVSFPRDLWVEIPGVGMQRINTAQVFGGFTTTQGTFLNNFGLTVHHYVLTNFWTFTGIIDTLGGIQVQAARNVTDHCKLPGSINGYCSYGPGTIFLDGQTALWYVRSRYSTSDFDRERRAQEVMLGILNKLLSLNGIQRAPELYQLFKDSVVTDMSLTDMLQLLPVASVITDPGKLQQYTIGSDMVTPYVTDSGADVLLPHTDAIWNILNQAINP